MRLETVRAVWAFYTAGRRRQASIREAAHQLGFHHTTILFALDQLELAGYIKREKGNARAIQVIIPFIEIRKGDIVCQSKE